MMNYSIAIRTLGKSGEKFVRELESIKRQTVQPDRIIVYIADGYERPPFTIGKEEYVWVKKGMVAQRALRYDEISSPLMLLLDDDVELEPTCAEELINSLETCELDCLAAETYQDHRLPILIKVYSAITNLVFPHWSNKWAFKIHSNGSFSYNVHITKDVYLSQSAAGPAALWKKDVFRNVHIDHELWLDRFEFSYGDDGLTFNKVYKNGYRLGVHYNCGITNLDAKSSSNAFQKNPKKYYTRSMASLMIWHRTCYNLKGLPIYKKAWAAIGFTFKTIWLFVIHIIASIITLSPKVLWYYSKGIYDGLKMIHSTEYRQIPNYILEQ